MSNKESTASCSIRFSLRRIASGAFDLDQSLQTVVADDDTAIQVVQIRAGKTTAIQWHKRAQFRRNDGQILYDHPFRFVFQVLIRFAETFYHTPGASRLLPYAAERFRICLVAKSSCHFVQVDPAQHGMHRRCSHVSNELVRIVVIQHLVLLTQSIQDVKIFFFRDQIMGVILFSSPLMVIPFKGSRLDHTETLVINYGVQFLGRHTKQISDLVGQ